MSWEDFCKSNSVSPRFENAHLSKVKEKNKDLFEEGIEWCKKPKSLILTGDGGRGKTFFSFALAREIIWRYGRGHIRWITAKRLDDKMVEAALENETTYMIETFCSINFLFLDDFGIDRGSERAERDFYEIIDRRWDHERITVISTNLAPDQIEKRYGARIFSRFKDFKWILFDGPDLRGRDLE